MIKNEIYRDPLPYIFDKYCDDIGSKYPEIRIPARKKAISDIAEILSMPNEESLSSVEYKNYLRLYELIKDQVNEPIANVASEIKSDINITDSVKTTLNTAIKRGATYPALLFLQLMSNKRPNVCFPKTEQYPAESSFHHAPHFTACKGIIDFLPRQEVAEYLKKITRILKNRTVIPQISVKNPEVCLSFREYYDCKALNTDIRRMESPQGLDVVHKLLNQFAWGNMMDLKDKIFEDYSPEM